MQSSAQQAFVIMQIGNKKMDDVYEKALAPAICNCGFSPRRVDKHNEEKLLKSEIVGFIQSANIIIADLTNERPNCYLEVGYAMGLDKFRNLILTAREDHFHNSPNYRNDGPKIHFDLSGYDILFWDPNDIEAFRIALEKKIMRRLAIISPTEPIKTKSWDDEWFKKHHDYANEQLKKSGNKAYMEIRTMLSGYGLSVLQNTLLQSAERAQIHTFGWPIGVVLPNNTNSKPSATPDGIVADIRGNVGESYDYWTIRKDGTFYLLKSLFEENRDKGSIFFNTRIVRITEALLHTARFYEALGVPSDAKIKISIEHGGLEGRVMRAAGQRMIFEKYESKENKVYTEIETSQDEIESRLADLVEGFTQPLFVVFNFFTLQKEVLEQIVNHFVAGKTT